MLSSEDNAVHFSGRKCTDRRLLLVGENKIQLVRRPGGATGGYALPRSAPSNIYTFDK